MAIGDLAQMAETAPLFNRPEALGIAAVDRLPGQPLGQRLQRRWWVGRGMPHLKLAKRLETEFPQQGNGIGIAGRAADHPAADLTITLLKHGLQKGALHCPEPVDALAHQLLGPLQGPAAAAAVDRLHHNSGQRAVRIQRDEAAG